MQELIEMDTAENGLCYMSMVSLVFSEVGLLLNKLAHMEGKEGEVNSSQVVIMFLTELISHGTQNRNA